MIESPLLPHFVYSSKILYVNIAYNVAIEATSYRTCTLPKVLFILATLLNLFGKERKILFIFSNTSIYYKI